MVSNGTDTGGSNRADREDHITHVTEDGLVLACGGEAGDGTDDLSCVQLDVAGKGFQVIHWGRVKKKGDFYPRQCGSIVTFYFAGLLRSMTSICSNVQCA